MQDVTLEILLATRNHGKIREIQELLEGLPLKLRLLEEFPNVLPIDEVGVTYQENASLKALGYSRQTGLCALADDSGLEVAALGGMPGVYSARFGGEGISDRDRVEILLSAISGRVDAERNARFVCALALAGWSDPESRTDDSQPQLLNLTEGTCDGIISVDIHGENGFGFDPVFIPQGYQRTLAELPPEVKRAISHRANALARMRTFLKHWVCPT